MLRSCKGTSTPSMFPNIDDKPKQNSMMKKRMDHKGETGILVIASVKTIKAKPVPSTPCGRFQKLQKLGSLICTDFKFTSVFTRVGVYYTTPQ